MRLPKVSRTAAFWAALTLGLLSCDSPSEETDSISGNDEPSASSPYPNFRGQDFHGEKNFAKLMNTFPQGKADPTPWAGYWWPYTGNGIAAGYGGGSPSGKYDAARGRSTQSQAWEVRNHGATVPRVQSWWGHCNGWCAAAALFSEPHDPVRVNGIEFGVRDIKGLLTEAGMSAYSDFFGERLDVDDPGSPKYWDTVPDQYFLVLTNYMGKLKHTVLIDRYTGAQVWNQPLAGYRFAYPKREDYLGNTPDAPNVYRIEVSSTIWWMSDNVEPDIQSPPFNYEEVPGVIDVRELRMEVWLDGPVVFDENGRMQSSGNVIVARTGEFVTGGAWRMGEGLMTDAWPDYMWIPYSVLKPNDPEQDYMNPEVDIDWLKTHLLTPGGLDDPNATPTDIEPAPPLPRPSTAPTTRPTPASPLFPEPVSPPPIPVAPPSSPLPFAPPVPLPFTPPAPPAPLPPPFSGPFPAPAPFTPPFPGPGPLPPPPPERPIVPELDADPDS